MIKLKISWNWHRTQLKSNQTKIYYLLWERDAELHFVKICAKDRSAFLEECCERFKEQIKGKKICNLSLEYLLRKNKSKKIEKIASIKLSRGMFGILLLLTVTKQCQWDCCRWYVSNSVVCWTRNVNIWEFVRIVQKLTYKRLQSTVLILALIYTNHWYQVYAERKWRYRLLFFRIYMITYH